MGGKHIWMKRAEKAGDGFESEVYFDFLNEPMGISNF